MNRWEALVKIVTAFTRTDHPYLALLVVALIVIVPTAGVTVGAVFLLR